jgi:hypothetical protein
MSAMFYQAASFDKDLLSWNTSSVENMRLYMLEDASSFNKDLAAWEVSKISTMFAMFYQAYSFDRNLLS